MVRLWTPTICIYGVVEIEVFMIVPLSDLTIVILLLVFQLCGFTSLF
jgi:hypothetical protein